MAQDKKYSLLDELSHCSGYDYALMTTFNFDIKFFERAILSQFYARGLKKISIFVDSKELNKSIKSVTNCHMGRKYMVNPIEMNGSFHPKLILLLGKKKARLFVGSANLTASGYTTNNEVFNFIDYSDKSPENLDIICTAIDFFIEANALSYRQDSALIREAVSQKYYRKPNQEGDCVLLYNTKSSILEQLTERITQRVEEIKVIVPYYDQQLLALNALKNVYTEAYTHLYIYKYLSTFPAHADGKESAVDEIEVFEGFNDNNSYSWNNFYHGKVILFRCVDADYILYGSANCTLSALVKSKNEGGNVECSLLEKGKKGEFDYFIDNLCISEDFTYTSSPILHDDGQDGCFSFKYGKYEEGITLHFRYRNKQEDLQISIGDHELDCFYENSELIVNISPETSQLLTDVFDVTIEYPNSIESIRCWVCIPSELDSNRYSSLITNSLDGVDIDSSGDKFAGDYTKIINAMNSCAADVEENIKRVAMRNVLQQEIEGTDVIQSDEGDEFIVEDTIPDEERFEYRRFDEVDRLRKRFLQRFIFGKSSIFRLPGVDRDTSKNKADNEHDAENPQRRKATTAEKRFERFVKRRIKEVFNPSYLSLISVEHYIGIMEVVFEIFKKYNIDDPVEGIFDTSYIINTRIAFYKQLLTKELKDTENLNDLEKTVITNCFATIVENQIIDGSIDTENANRSFLEMIENKYQLRDTYGKYITNAMDRGETAVVQRGYERSCELIDALYGYKSQKQLYSFIMKYYENAQIEIVNKTIRIKAEAHDINQHGFPLREVLKEITRYSRKYEPINNVHIEVKNSGDIRHVKNIRTLIKHDVRLESHQWMCESEYKDGSSNKTKSRYLEF